MPTYAFVDQVAASPTILFDLDNQSPFSVVVGTQTPPPQKRFSASSSTARDGDNIAQSSYNDRVLTIALRVELNTTAEEQAEGIQKINRLLDAPQWLMWQHDTMIEPVFFRTRRGDLSIDDNMMVDKPKRTLVLTIPAEPFAYGLPVTGTTTIANDPTAATNPMSYVFPDIQGDVAAPLSLKIEHDGTNPARCLVSSIATKSPSQYPLYAEAEATSVPAAASGWSISDVTDTACIGGKRRTAVKASGTNKQFMFSPNLNPSGGDFRVYLRADVTAPSTISLEFNALTLASRTITVARGAKWVDMGVVRLPVNSPPEHAAFGTPIPFTSHFGVYASSSAATATVSVDGVLLVPCQPDSGFSATTALVDLPAFGSATRYLLLDSLFQTAVYTSDPSTGSVLVSPSPAVFAGGFPRVTPGLSNVLHFIAQTYDSDTTSASPITGGTVVTYTYYPRYLYIRPATS